MDIAEGCGVSLTTMALFNVAGYLMGIPELYTFIPGVEMAFTSAIGFLLTGVAILSISTAIDRRTDAGS